MRALARASRILERASGDLSLAHYRVLSAIASGNPQASKIAARLALGKPTVSAAVEALCRRGLLDRSGAPDDQRAVVLSLTDKGMEVLAEVEAAMVARVVELSALSPNPAQLLRCLAWLGDAVDQSHELGRHRDPRWQAAQDEGTSPA